MAFGLSCECEINCSEWMDGLQGKRTNASWHLGFHVSEWEFNWTQWLGGLHSTSHFCEPFLGYLGGVKPIAPRGRMVYTVKWLMAFGLSCKCKTNRTKWPNGLHGKRSVVMRRLVFLVRVKPMALSGRMVCTVKQLLLFGIRALL